MQKTPVSSLIPISIFWRQRHSYYAYLVHLAMSIPRIALATGMNTDKAIMKKPVLLIFLILLAATIPMSSKKNARTP